MAPNDRGGCCKRWGHVAPHDYPSRMLRGSIWSGIRLVFCRGRHQKALNSLLFAVIMCCYEGLPPTLLDVPSSLPDARVHAPDTGIALDCAPCLDWLQCSLLPAWIGYSVLSGLSEPVTVFSPACLNWLQCSLLPVWIGYSVLSCLPEPVTVFSPACLNW